MHELEWKALCATTSQAMRAHVAPFITLISKALTSSEGEQVVLMRALADELIGLELASAYQFVSFEEPR